MNGAAVAVSCALSVCFATAAQAEVWLRSGTAVKGDKLLVTNAGLETPGERGAEGWLGWQRGGYELDEKVAHTGQRSARCSFAGPDIQCGVYQNVTLNQEEPVAILARCWSRAENVSGAPDSNYSLYLDLVYTDGTPLWGQVMPFNTGTHDWEQATVLVMPAKPVKSLSIYGIFRGHEGTVWFDDFELYEVKGLQTFDLQAAAGDIPEGGHWERIDLGDGAQLLLDAQTGVMSLDPQRRGGIVLRDAAAGSDFILPRLKVERAGEGWRLTGEDAELQLRVDATLRPASGALRLDVTVRDLSGKDRAVTVYWALPMPAGAWIWCQDARRRHEVTPTASGAYFVNVGCGSNGLASKYPFGAVVGRDRGLAIGAPITQPRLCRFSMDGPRRVLYGAFDLGLCAETRDFPSSAGFSAILYPFAPQWKFRSALARYYELNAEAFRGRAEKHGIWMPFVDISTVDGWRDFGFQFQEGAPNPAFDEEHGIYSFPYIEPLSFWMSMPPGMPRTEEAALKYLDELAARGEPRAVATKNCAFHGPTGRMWMTIADAPWCNGALFINNASPGVAGSPDAPTTQYRVHETVVKSILSDRTMPTAWQAYGAGFRLAPGEGVRGAAAVCKREELDPPMGAQQRIVINQEQPRPIIASAASKAENVTGNPDGHYSLYIDCTYADGTPLYGQIAAFSTGTHDWEEVTVRIEPAKPVQSLTLHLLLRGDHFGKAWFDEVSVREEGSDRELCVNGSFEETPRPVQLDGLYFDSFEMAATELNYRREHFAGAQLPLVYDRSGRLCQMGYFITMELLMDFAAKLHAVDKMTFANGVLWNFPWAAGFLDVFGTETNWMRDGKFVPDSDEQMLYWRAMAAQRPYLTLLNTRFENFPHDWVEKYFARCAYYGVLPSMFSHNAADEVYWNRPNIYNRDRDLFLKYIPVIRAMSQAGWEPVTLAETSRPDVWVERYGSKETAYFAVFNPTDMAVDVRLKVDLKALTGGQQVKAELLLPEQLDLGTATGDVWNPAIALRPDEVAVLQLTW